MKKITKKDNLMMIREYVKENAELLAFVDHEIELLNKKKSTANPENENIKNVIVEEMKLCGKAMTISDMQGNNDVLKELSNQKISALLRQLIADEIVSKELIKKKAFFSLV